MDKFFKFVDGITKGVENHKETKNEKKTGLHERDEYKAPVVYFGTPDLVEVEVDRKSNPLRPAARMGWGSYSDDERKLYGNALAILTDFAQRSGAGMDLADQKYKEFAHQFLKGSRNFRIEGEQVEEFLGTGGPRKGEPDYDNSEEEAAPEPKPEPDLSPDREEEGEPEPPVTEGEDNTCELISYAGKGDLKLRHKGMIYQYKIPDWRKARRVVTACDTKDHAKVIKALGNSKLVSVDKSGAGVTSEKADINENDKASLLDEPEDVQKEIMNQYEQIRLSGKYNMYDQNGVNSLASEWDMDELSSFIDKGGYPSILKNYSELAKKFGIRK